MSSTSKKRNIENANNNHDHSPERMYFWFQNINSWIIHADSKVSIVFAVMTGVYGAILAFLITSIVNYQSLETISWNRWIAFVLTLLGIVCFILSLAFGLSALFPRLWKTASKGENDDTNTKIRDKSLNCMFYADIALFSNHKDYKQYLSRLNDGEINNALLEEIVTNSKICSTKMKQAKTTILFSFVAILINVLAMIFLLLFWV